MDSDQHRLLSDSSRSAISLQDPNYIPDESERDSVFHLPANEDDRVSLRSRSSSISTTTDDQALLLQRSGRLSSFEHPPPASSSGQRRVKSAAVISALSRRKRGIQPLGEELERIKANLSHKVPREPVLGSHWTSDVDAESGSSSSLAGGHQRRVKSAAPYSWLGRSRSKVAPAPLSDINDDDELKDTDSISSSINAWEPHNKDTPTSQATSQMCLTSSRTKSQPTVFGKSKNRVYPLLPTEEAGDAAITVSSGRGTLDVFVSSEGVAVEEATGEMISESQESCSDSLQDRAQLEIPHSVEHAPYIPLASAQEALTRVVNDMKQMKEEHIDLVERMQDAYREIEEESKVQYREYVQQLKKQHGSKTAVYKQVVKMLQEEMDKMKEYWEGTANSLANRNRNLLLENKELHQELKDGAENMKKEKERTVLELTGRIEAERRKREEEKREAQEEIYYMQTKCSSMVRQAEQTAEEKLAKEKVQHEQLMEELGKQLAERQARLKELERDLALERISARDTKVIVSKEAEAVPLLTRPVEAQPSNRVELKTDKPDSQLGYAEEVQLKTKIGKARKELKQAQAKLQSMVALVGSEPGLRDVLEERMEEVKHEIDTLKSERDELTEQGEAESNRDESEGESDERLKEINSRISALDHKLQLMQLLRANKGPQVPTIPVKKAKPARPVTKNEHPSEAESTTSAGQPPGVEASRRSKEEDKSMSATSEADVEADEEDSPTEILGDESHVEALEEEQDEVNEEEVAVDDDVEESEEDKNEEANERVRPVTEEEEEEEDEDEEVTPEVVHGEQVSLEMVSKPKTEPARAQAARSSTQQSAASHVQSGDPKLQEELKKLKQQVNDFKKQQQADKTTIKTLQKELKTSSKAAGGGAAGGGSVEDKRELKKKEKEIKELSRQNEIAKKNLEKIQAQLKLTDSELTALKKDNDKLVAELKEKNAEFQKLSTAAKTAVEASEKAKSLEQEVKKQSAEIKTLSENYNSERILRKKYYNLIEDMKGKIRVYCRARPLSSSEKARNNFSVIESPDEYTLNVKTTKGVKEFQFDQVFTPEHSQEKVFEDTKNLIQSAVDGYNVCIFAYGQTGSGKTYTMIGGKDGNNQIVAPGIAPRAFETIYELVDANRSKFNFVISCYMLELYNDKLLDLFQSSHKEPPKLDIKKDKKGLVVVNGAVVHHADSAVGLMELFELGSKNRHVSSTKMNAESSRSHLVVGIVIESTNITNGTVHRGKLSIVDLAGSERASKTGATPEQLREAQSINKSLSALGDVISALSSGQDFIPYRNNKLTMLMQDSLGGNAKTLMFVNISPADYNAEETVVSLTYAARVKLITNDASKNVDNKEIARLKGIIAKLKKGEAVEDDD